MERSQCGCSLDNGLYLPVSCENLFVWLFVCFFSYITSFDFLKLVYFEFLFLCLLQNYFCGE